MLEAIVFIIYIHRNNKEKKTINAQVDLPLAHEYISQTTRMTVSYYPSYIRVRIPDTVDFNVTIKKPTLGIHGSGANYVSYYYCIKHLYLFVSIINYLT